MFGWDFVFGCVFIYWLIKASPQLIAEVIAELEHARSGEESPAARARRERLEKEGIDPSSGGPMRQYVGNVWRDFWLDMEKARRKRRAQQEIDEAVAAWQRRFAERLDARIDDQLNRWRTNPKPSTGSSTHDNTPPSAGSRPDQQQTQTQPDSGDKPTTGSRTSDPDPDPFDDSPGVVHDDPEFTGGTYTEPKRPPIRVAAVVGDPIYHNDPKPTPKLLELTAGENMTTSNAVVAVTGVTSGAAEARNILRVLETATEEYIAQLNRLRDRIIALGEQTVGTVQMSTHSRVVNGIAQATEAAAAAQQAAKECGSEVAPLLVAIAREFDRLSS